MRLKNVQVFSDCPEGWKVLTGATTAPDGYVWISNGKSRFDGEYEHGILTLQKSA